MDDLEARGKLVQLVFGHMAAAVISAATGFGLADLIGDGEPSAEDLARRCEAHPESLTRLLRAMAALELLTEPRPGRFALTSMGALLRTDRPDSMDAVARMFTDRTMVAAWDRLGDSVRTGRIAFDEVFGTDFFTYLGSRPELSALFNASMSQGTLSTAAVLPAVYDFARFHTICDVGGGDGTLLAAILGKHPALRGILFDTPAGLGEAPATLDRAGVAERCTTVSGDFFASVPEGGDLYLLKSVIHDWDDERAITILRNCRRAMPDSGRLIVLERVLPDTVDGSAHPIVYVSDLNMMVNLGGRERLRADFETLFAASGFTLTSVTPLPPPAIISVIEAAPVSGV